MNSKDYILIQGWMINELGLKSNELIVFAIIFGFSKDQESLFNGSLKYLQASTGATKNTVIKALNSLVERDLIIKITEVRNGITFNSYAQNAPVVQKLVHPGLEIGTGVPKNGRGVVQKLVGGVPKNGTNNTNNNLFDNTTNNSTNKKAKPNFDFEHEDLKDKEGAAEKIELAREHYKSKEIVLPWESNQFIYHWLLYRYFRKKEHGFMFKTEISEQAALNKLTKISTGEVSACNIILQSIENNWKGLFTLKNDGKANNNSNGSTIGTGANKISSDYLRRIRDEIAGKGVAR